MSRKKQTRKERYLGVKDVSPNSRVKTWRIDKYNLHPTRQIARRYMDYDYLSKLSKEEYQWLMQFTREYYLDLYIGGKPLHSENLKVTCYSANNSRRRCYNLADGSPIPKTFPFSHKSPEDAIIWLLDKFYFNK